MLEQIILLLLLFCNVLFYFLSFRDMKERRENRLLWFLKFFFLGPFAVSWYKSVRTLKENEDRRGGTAYNLARNFIGPWCIYLLVLPVIIFALAGVLDYAAGIVDAAYLGETIMWMVIFYFFFILPAWAMPAIVSLIVILAGRPSNPMNGQKIMP